jgi:putative membrane protein
LQVFGFTAHRVVKKPHRHHSTERHVMKKVLAVAAVVLALAAVGVTAAAASPPPQDENWLMTSISGDRFEIAGGKIALARATTPQARALARRLIADHAKSLREASELARRWGMKPPPAATPSQQWQLNRLKNMSKSQFDVQYASLEVKDHNQDIEETGFEAREGQAWEIRMDAKHELPMLNMHLRLSKSTLQAAEAARGA